MRWLRASVLTVLVLASGRLLVGATAEPVLGAWEVLHAGGSDGSAAAPVDLAALLTGGCALALLGAWAWLAVAVVVCTGEALRSGPAGAGARGGPDRPTTVLRPRLVRGLVAAALGVTVVTVPLTAHARGERPGPAGQVAAAATTGAQLLTPPLSAPAPGSRSPHAHPLRGLPVPDRPTGRLAEPELDRGSRGQVTPTARRLEVRPGDSLWGLASALLPAGVPDATVAAGCHLLHAANRDVIGADPDLLQPGQLLHVPDALTAPLRPTTSGGPR